jgi:hypothetical protein
VSDAPVGDPARGVLLDQTLRHAVPPARLAYPGPLLFDSRVAKSRCAERAPTEVPDLVCSLDVLPITGSGQAPRGGYAEEEDPELSAT